MTQHATSINCDRCTYVQCGLRRIGYVELLLVNVIGLYASELHDKGTGLKQIRFSMRLMNCNVNILTLNHYVGSNRHKDKLTY